MTTPVNIQIRGRWYSEETIAAALKEYVYSSSEPKKPKEHIFKAGDVAEATHGLRIIIRQPGCFEQRAYGTNGELCAVGQVAFCNGDYEYLGRLEDLLRAGIAAQNR